MTKRYYGTDAPRSTGPHPDPLAAVQPGATPAEYRALADRVEAGETGQEIDDEIMALFYRRGERHIGVYDDGTDEPVLTGVWIDPETDKWVGTHAREFTTSLDAVEALRVAKLPGWTVEKVVELRGETGVWRWVAQLRKIEDRTAERVHDAHSHGPTEPTARLAAVLMAMAAQMEADDAGN